MSWKPEEISGLKNLPCISLFFLLFLKTSMVKEYGMISHVVIPSSHRVREERGDTRNFRYLDAPCTKSSFVLTLI